MRSYEHPLFDRESRLHVRLSPHLWPILAVALAPTVFQALTCMSPGDQRKPLFAMTGVDINPLQNRAFSLFLMLSLRRSVRGDISLLRLVASWSFAIYFLHGWFIYIISLFQRHYRDAYGPHFLFVLTPLAMIASYWLARPVKTQSPRHSRLLVGW